MNIHTLQHDPPRELSFDEVDAEFRTNGRIFLPQDIAAPTDANRPFTNLPPSVIEGYIEAAFGFKQPFEGGKPRQGDTETESTQGQTEALETVVPERMGAPAPQRGL